MGTIVYIGVYKRAPASGTFPAQNVGSKPAVIPFAFASLVPSLWQPDKQKMPFRVRFRDYLGKLESCIEVLVPELRDMGPQMSHHILHTFTYLHGCPCLQANMLRQLVQTVPGSTHAAMPCSKEFKSSYHNGYMYRVNNRVSPIQ